MKKIYLLLSIVIMTLMGNAQVTVTNPSNTTPGLAGSYTSLALAITALNAQTAISGPVTITLNAGNPQTCPSGGYSITAVLSGASGTNRVTIDGSGNTITTPSPAGIAGALNDAIFKFIGSDFMTLQNFVMNENAANTTTSAATNNMVEFGVALFYATTTNGAQNINIQNNTITLNRNYQNTWGVYSNSTHSVTTVTVSATATTTAGGNSGLKIYGNTISNVNQGICVVGPTTDVDMNTGLDIGGIGGGQANSITNWGTTGTFSAYANVSQTLNCILVMNSPGFNVSFNTLTSSVGGNTTTVSERAIYVQQFSMLPSGTFASTINNNNISLQSGFATGTLNGIIVDANTGTATSSLTMNSNNFYNFGHTVAGSGNCNFLYSKTTNLNTTINSNTFTAISLNTTGSVTFISNDIIVPTGGSQTINNNAIVTSFSKTGAGNTIMGIHTAGNSLNITSNWNNNNFSNMTITGATILTVINQNDGGSVNHNITGNTISNITGGTGKITGILSNHGGVSGGNGNLVSGNTIAGIISAGDITGIDIGFFSSGGLSTVTGNTINGLATTGASAVIAITSGAPTNCRIYKNKIYDLQANNALGTVTGIEITNGTLHTVYNNLIGDLRTPSANAANPLIGLNISGGTTVNVYNNTIYIAGTSSGALFGSSAVSVITTATVTFNNNIFYNNSGANGAGLATAYRRSNTTLTSYSASSNKNLFFGSTIFTDGTNTDATLSAYKTRVASRDAGSVTEDLLVKPTFLSTTGSNANFLHISTSVATVLESGGAPVAGITIDFDGDARNATTPDIGADEFAGSLTLPVGLLSFNGYKSGNVNRLVWTTSNEQNNLGFEILRSNDGINYTTLGFVNSLSIGGNSSSLLNYSYNDNNLAGGNQYYRLRQLDIDGHGKLSVIVLIKGDLSLTLAFDKLFPNPASTVVNVLIVVPNHDKINLIVTDIIGTRVMNKLVNVESGNNTIPVDISRLANGTYMVKLVCSSECLEAVGKFVKQ